MTDSTPGGAEQRRDALDQAIAQEEQRLTHLQAEEREEQQEQQEQLLFEANA